MNVIAQKEFFVSLLGYASMGNVEGTPAEEANRGFIFERNGGKFFFFVDFCNNYLNFGFRSYLY